MTPRDRLIVAIDEPDLARAEALIEGLEGAVDWLKIGMTLYYRAGPAWVGRLVTEGWKIFVDLKCHDIPHQVSGAVSAIADTGAGLTTVHAAGGPAMLEAAASALQGTDTRLLAITVLTSLDADTLARVGPKADPLSLVLQRSLLASASGCDGIVASPLEASPVASRLPAGFEIVTPGIRPPGADHGDQRRVASPEGAISAGATRLVVGRPITTAPDPSLAAAHILASIPSAP